MQDVTPFTVRAVIRGDKANAKGLCPISVCVTIKGKRAYVTTGLRILPANWEAGRVWQHPNAPHYNNQIAKKLTHIEAELLKSPPADIKAALAVLSSAENNRSFNEYAERVLATFDIADNTRRRWGYDLQHVKNFAPNLTWAQITPAWLTLFNRHLCGHYECKDHPSQHSPTPGNCSTCGSPFAIRSMIQNSARKTFVFIRRVFNEAKEDGTCKLYPFDNWQLPAEVQTPKQYLTLDEIDKIRDLLFKRPDFSKAMRSTIAHFLLECFAGIRHSDWSKWQVERLTDGESLHLVTTKTGEPIYLPLKDSPRLAEIVNYIRDNDLAYRYTVQNANEIMKEVVRHLELKKHVTTHTARHSCATLLLQKGFSKETVAEVLGVSMKVIDTYAKMTRQKVRMEFERIGGL